MKTPQEPGKGYCNDCGLEVQPTMLCKCAFRQKKTPQDYVNEFTEVQFVSCPTETEEPFFWKWTNEGKEIIESFLLTSLEEYGKQCEEKGRVVNRLNK